MASDLTAVVIWLERLKQE